MQYLKISAQWISKERGEEEDSGTLVIPCEILRSARKTMSLQIREEGILQIRVPLRMTAKDAMDFAKRNGSWIGKHYIKSEENRRNNKIYSEEDIVEYKKKLRPVLEHRVAYYAEVMGITYNRLAIRDQKTRWGSCSSKGNLNFNWKLVLMPQEILDYVVVHELAHRLQMNHSNRFWAQVEQILPDYKIRRKWLKEYGGQQS